MHTEQVKQLHHAACMYQLQITASIDQFWLSFKLLIEIMCFIEAKRQIDTLLPKKRQEKNIHDLETSSIE